MHPVRELLDQLPELLVEPGQVRRPGRLAAGVSLHRRQPRRGDRRTARQPRGSVSPVPLPRHHELRRRVPEEPEPHQGDQQDQGTDGAPRHLAFNAHASRRRCAPTQRADQRTCAEQAQVAVPARPARERPVHCPLLREARGKPDLRAGAGIGDIDGSVGQRSAGPAASEEGARA
ncbi:hypothetical protein VARIO8X_110243 [Burkholderiales bacterium 8X]|nr:hypothetical protein VARIO8X_110243 [Burkholderiales bacterium 8X]